MATMFKVDRASASVVPFPAPGIYEVDVVKLESAMTGKGDHQAKLIFRSKDGHVASDTFLNRESMWWRLNMILAAIPAVKVDDGTELDLSKNPVFDGFLAQFVGKKVQIKLEEESYVKEGEKKTVLRVKRYLAVKDAGTDNPY